MTLPHSVKAAGEEGTVTAAGTGTVTEAEAGTVTEAETGSGGGGGAEAETGPEAAAGTGPEAGTETGPFGVQVLDLEVQVLDLEVQVLDPNAHAMLAPMAKPKTPSASLIATTAKNAIARHKKRGEDALALIERRAALISEAFYEIGVALQTLRKVEVYSALGHSSFDELVTERTRLSRTMAFDLVRIADHYTARTALGLGPEKAKSLLALVRNTEEKDDAETLARTDARIAGKPISKTSASELRRAASTLRPRAVGRDGDADTLAAQIAKRLAPRKKGAPAPTVTARKRRDGWWIRVDLPIDQARAVKWR